ncbi:MAG: hypothetical protein GY810_15545, partial [Aureispira sp.]|nr:hypothetical protein [Aureispira sp.]
VNVLSTTLFNDTALTETTRATIDAYTLLSNGERIYDRLHSEKVVPDTSIASFPTYETPFVTAVGKVLDFGDITCVIKDTGDTVVITSDNTGTITMNCGDTLTVTTDGFNAIKSSTGIVVDGDTVIDGWTTEGDLYINSAQDLTDVTINGDLRIATGADSVLSFTNVTVTGSVWNDSDTNTLEIQIDSTSDMTAGDEGTGAGETNIVGEILTFTSSGVIVGSRIQLYNVTTSLELDNTIDDGNWSYQDTDGNIAIDDIIRLRVTHTDGATAMLPFEGLAIASATGGSFLVSQEDDEIYNAYAIDGSTITGFEADYVDNEFDITIANNWTAKDLYSWSVYNQTTQEGIQAFFGAFEAIDIANLRINTDILNVYFDNNTSTNVHQTDNIRIYRADELYPVKNPTTGGGGIDVVWRDKVFIAETGVSGLTTSESSILSNIEADTNELQTNQGNFATATGFATEVKQDIMQTDITTTKKKATLAANLSA